MWYAVCHCMQGFPLAHKAQKSAIEGSENDSNNNISSCRQCKQLRIKNAYINTDDHRDVWLNAAMQTCVANVSSDTLGLSV